MKKILALLLLLALKASAQSVAPPAAPDIEFKTILNAPVKTATLTQLQGKIVLLEFWATWCGACLTAMPHLQALQKKYNDNLQVITITDESTARVRQYLAARPANVWFAIDTARALARAYPHQLLPHTVLIDANGNVIDNTLPEQVTTMAIDSLLRGQTVHLTPKKDLLYRTPKDLIDQIFYASNTVKSRFMMQGEIKGGPGLSSTYLKDSIWSGRRITALNCGLTTLYRIAYPGFGFSRIVDQTPAADRQASYCLDIIVGQKAGLLPKLQRELLKRFDVQAKPIKQIREVYVMKIADKHKFHQIKLNATGNKDGYARHGEIDQQKITMQEFAAYLEDYCTGPVLVKDETGSTAWFDIKFNYQPENSQSLTDILENMGISLTKQQREVTLLQLYKRNVL
jgi:thiol-disulfide isomerase/thioredoxin